MTKGQFTSGGDFATTPARVGAGDVRFSRSWSGPWELQLTCPVKRQRFDTPKLSTPPPRTYRAWVPGDAQEIRKTSKVASSRKFPPQKAVTCCMMAR